MATESVTTQSVPPRDPDPKVRAAGLHDLVVGLSLDLWQIKAVVTMLANHSALESPDFPEDVAGGIEALRTLVTKSSDTLSARF